MLPAKLVTANTERKTELALNLLKVVERHTIKMFQGYVLAVSLESSFWVDVWLFFLSVDRILTLFSDVF